MKKKFASQTAQKPRKNVIRLIVSALALCASPGITLADSCIGQTNWNVPSGNWFVGANWSAGVPNSITSAQINNGGTATIGSTGAESCDLTLGGAATESGTVVVDHGAYAISFDAAVGGYGRGVLTIANGGTVTAALAAIAGVAGSNGAATVAGTNSQWTLNGELDVGAGGKGSLSVTNGGNVSSGGTSIASQTGSNGSATVDGTGSTLTVSGDADVGTGGTGLLTVTNGGTVSATNAHEYGSGTLTGNGTVSTTSGTTIYGTLAPSSGRLTISTGDLSFNGNTGPLMLSKVTPTSQDNVYVSAGAASLNGRLSVTMTGNFTPGTTYTLLHAENGLFGTTFFSVSITYPCECFKPEIQYGAKDVNLYLAPAACCQ